MCRKVIFDLSPRKCITFFTTSEFDPVTFIQTVCKGNRYTPTVFYLSSNIYHIQTNKILSSWNHSGTDPLPHVQTLLLLASSTVTVSLVLIPLLLSSHRVSFQIEISSPSDTHILFLLMFDLTVKCMLPVQKESPRPLFLVVDSYFPGSHSNLKTLTQLTPSKLFSFIFTDWHFNFIKMVYYRESYNKVLYLFTKIPFAWPFN